MTYRPVTGCGIVRGMTIFDDLAAEQERLEEILLGLDEAQWLSASAAQGWTIADVVLHLAQSEEGVEATAAHRPLRAGLGAVAGDTMDDRAAEAVRLERAAPAEVFARWQRARQAALAAVRAADPDQPLEWVAGPVKPATLATTRLAEHWAHGLDITGPLGIEFPDTERLRHVAWLAHRTLPYALSLAGQPPVAVRCELTAPDGAARRRWRGRLGHVAVRAAGRRVGDHRDGRRLLPGRRAAARPGAVRPAGQRAARRHRPAGAANLRGLVQPAVRATLGQSRGSTGSDSRARTAKTHSWTRQSGSPRATRSRASRPRAYSRSASERLWLSPRWRSRARLAGSV